MTERERWEDKITGEEVTGESHPRQRTGVQRQGVWEAYRVRCPAFPSAVTGLGRRPLRRQALAHPGACGGYAGLQLTEITQISVCLPPAPSPHHGDDPRADSCTVDLRKPVRQLENMKLQKENTARSHSKPQSPEVGEGAVWRGQDCVTQ